MRPASIGPITRKIWDEELATRLLFLGVRTAQVYSIIPMGKQRANALGQEIDSRTVKPGRTPGIVDMCESYINCCHVSFASACFKLADDMLTMRGGPRDGHFGERICRAIQLYRADIRLTRKFEGDQIFECCRANRANELCEEFCPYCAVPYFMSYRSSRPLRCPFCAVDNDRTDVMILRELTQKTYVRIGKGQDASLV